MANELIVKYGVVLNSGETFSGSSLVTKDYVDGLNSIISLTYSTLYNYVVNGQLIPGQWYRLTDYKSVNFLNGWSIADNNPIPSDPNFSPRELYVGSEEVLILQAKTEYEISEIGYSEQFSKDIIEYEPFVNKIGVNVEITNGNVLPDSSTVSGFDLQWDGTNVYFNMPSSSPALFGHFMYLYCEFDNGTSSYGLDGVYEPLTPNITICNYPYIISSNLIGMSRLKIVDNGLKVILLDLVQQDYTNYIVDTLYVSTVYPIGDCFGWITRRRDTSRFIDVPFDFRGRKYRRFGVNLSSLNSSLGTGFYGQGDNYKGQGTTGTFSDFSVFGNDNQDYYNLEINSLGGPDAYYYRGYNDNNVFLGVVSYCSFGNSVYNNTVGTIFGRNECEDFYSNTVGSYFISNIIQKYSINCLIGSFCTWNVIQSLSSCNISSSLSYNEFFGLNQYLTIGSNFRYNKISYGLSFIDFTSSTHVYNDYNCTIFKRSDGQMRLSYLNGSDVMQYVTITS